MNTGKVRIYELSKELNLDNRDILAVCDKLNISVKSHSSTITEDEAARIRTAAEKYAHSHTSSKTSGGHGSSKSSAVQPPAKKQQILEVRRNQPLVGPPKRPTTDAKAVPPSQPAPPPPPNRPAVKMDAPEEMTPDVEETDQADLTAPVETPEVTPSVVAPDSPDPSEHSEDSSPESSLSQDLSAPEPVSPTVKPEPVAEVSPELVSPPSRPVPRSPEPVRSESQPTNLSNRPILKRTKIETSTSASQEKASGRETSDRSGREVASGSKDGPRRIGNTAGASTLIKPKAVPELRRKPTRPSAEGSDGDDKAPATTRIAEGDSATSVVSEVDPLELRRPAPPRPPKRHKGWEEEEEDEEAAKASKAVPKAKRRAQPVIDDEEEDIEDILEEFEDEDEADEDENAATQVNLSLMRPPKPKRTAPMGKPATPSAPMQKPKRSGESRNLRRDRRQEEIRQKPEEVVITGSMSVHDLADLLVVPETDIIKALFFKGIAANINQILDIPTITMVAEEFDVIVTTAEAEAEAKKVTEMLDAADLDKLQRRPPVVTIMGHVDHGKTTLLDSIRKTKVAQGEAGGITQHIGAYHVDVEMGGQVQQVVFLDTPGHEAFTAMRARGARVTDIAVLVVAADDGVRPQTIEAISHAKAAQVPIVVAINKIDKEDASPDRVKQELTEYGLVPEEWGGDTIMVPVSAIQGENLDTLLEMLLLVAEVEDLYANPDRLARGTVIEANLDKSRGPVATLIVQNGTLKVGDVLVAGSAFGKVRAMVDDRGKRVDKATPSFAVEVLGLGDVPAAGDEFEVYKDEKEARAVANTRVDQQRQSRLQQAMASRRVSLNTLSAQAQEGELKELNLILKADVQGSVEAILGALQQLPQKEVQVRVLLAAPGEITETDVDLAAASSAVIIGFNTTFASGARQAADELDVDVRDYNIIYKLLEDVQGAMEGLLEPEMVEEPLGQAEVRAVFPVGRGTVAGCYVQSGKMVRNCKVRVVRRGEVLHTGNLDSLKRMKEDAREVNAGYECGIGVDSFKDWVEGDIIEAFRLVSKRRTLSV
ncbi:translation initiation factor IF-2 [Thermocoleostomius sinensis]|uniref:Translation initiation factor IF-2 n=1 Tax=Thermocoleostomius sinensis A174 TaxID=2016057 RepID=A0A9E8ZDP7_9CYAN|nr:translation initiation factor IF-2 [Thermocoleostomius sinensis]WAL60014.1 translation initiation factor IF-2 [Thermocoleostomius sinensis A174]